MDAINVQSRGGRGGGSGGRGGFVGRGAGRGGLMDASMADLVAVVVAEVEEVVWQSFLLEVVCGLQPIFEHHRNRHGGL